MTHTDRYYRYWIRNRIAADLQKLLCPFLDLNVPFLKLLLSLTVEILFLFMSSCRLARYCQETIIGEFRCTKNRPAVRGLYPSYGYLNSIAPRGCLLCCLARHWLWSYRVIILLNSCRFRFNVNTCCSDQRHCLTNVQQHKTWRPHRKHGHAGNRWIDLCTQSQCDQTPSTTGTLHVASSRGCFVFSVLRKGVVWLPTDQILPELLPLSPLSAHLSHLITLRLCLCVLVSLATCLQQWRELWPQNGRRTVPWRDKARLRETGGKWKPAIKAELKGTSHDICRAQKHRSELGNGRKRGGSETDEVQITKPNLHKLWA